jgi:hypothetical protein
VLVYKHVINNDGGTSRPEDFFIRAHFEYTIRSPDNPDEAEPRESNSLVRSPAEGVPYVFNIPTDVLHVDRLQFIDQGPGVNSGSGRSAITYRVVGEPQCSRPLSTISSLSVTNGVTVICHITNDDTHAPPQNGFAEPAPTPPRQGHVANTPVPPPPR